MKEITDAEFDGVVAKGATMVDFWAPWCAPCRNLAPTLERLAEAHPGVRFVKVNVDENQLKATEFGIRNIPTVQLWLDGHLVQTMTGARSFDYYDAILQGP